MRSHLSHMTATRMGMVEDTTNAFALTARHKDDSCNLDDYTKELDGLRPPTVNSYIRRLDVPIICWRLDRVPCAILFLVSQRKFSLAQSEPDSETEISPIHCYATSAS